MGLRRRGVARRLAVAFLASAALPIVAMAVLSLVHTERVISAQAVDSLREYSRVYGQSIYERLILAESVLARLATSIDAGKLVTPVDISRQFDGVAQRMGGADLLLGGEAAALPEADLADQTLPRPGRGALWLGRADPPPIYLAYRHTPRLTLLARLDRSYLFGDAERHPFQTSFCVLGARSGRALYCPDLPPGAVKDALASGAGRRPAALDLQGREATMLGAYWEIFLPGTFDHESWRVVAAQPRAHALRAVSAFQWLFPPVMGLALTAAAVLGLAQIRRTYRPLERLLAGVRRIASGHFDTRVETGSRDEFGELAEAMNSMADSLGHQFQAADTLSRLDRMILSSQGVEAIVETVLTHLATLLPGVRLGVLVLDRNRSDEARLFLAGAGECLRMRRTLLELEAVAELDGSRSVLEFTAGQTWPSYAGPLSDEPAATLHVMPVRQDNTLWGALLLAPPMDKPMLGRDLGHAATLADRLAVALSAARREEMLYRQGHFDALTGLPNRHLLAQRLAEGLAWARRDEHLLGVLFIDLDRFNNINDSAGHPVGDQVLLDAARRLETCVRGDDTVARLGGDEFVVLLTEVEDMAEVAAVGRRILARLGEPFTHDEQHLFVGASIGVAVYPEDGQTALRLLKNADTAMYRAKETGRGRVVYFETTMDDAVQSRVRLEADLHHALQHGEFHLEYQPQVTLPEGRPVAAEALLRWDHPRRGRVPPQEFIPLLEETGLIDAVGEWVLRTACTDLQRWLAEGHDLDWVSVNVSTRQFADRQFPALVARVLAATGLAPRRLELEITESLLASDPEAVRRSTGELKDLGVRISLDDFGTGYSSLSYLRRFPIDTLKIDRAFLTEVPDGGRADALVRAIVAMGHAMNKAVIGEGVETPEQARFLAEAGCEVAQGFLFYRPLRAERLAEVLAEPPATALQAGD